MLVKEVHAKQTGMVKHSAIDAEEIGVISGRNYSELVNKTVTEVSDV